MRISDSDIKKRVIETVQLHRNFVTLKDNMIQLRKNYSAYNNVSSFNVPGTRQTIILSLSLYIIIYISL